jgi:hypothetical protein
MFEGSDAGKPAAAAKVPPGMWLEFARRGSPAT